LLLQPVEPLAERWEFDAVRIVLLLEPPGTRSELDPPVRHVVDPSPPPIARKWSLRKKAP
jgi:hypothetical protein